MSEQLERLNAALEGRYEIEHRLGEGGMATVYLANDLRHERRVALKVLKPELAAVIGAERFVTEIKTTANLQHPHILPLFDSGESDGFLYYVMPYIEGETLRGRLDREKQIGVDEALRITKDVADALDYAHRNDVIHRDIKPENILLHDGRPVVADFGIALAVSAAGGGRMTETGLSLGTPYYMSPEQATADRDLSARSDVYSLGCVLYEMLAGDPPHHGSSAQGVLVKILTEDPRPVSELRRSVPPHVAAAVSKALERLPADRFESAASFGEALDDESFAYEPRLRETTAALPAAPVPVRRSSRTPLLAMATVTLVSLGLAAVGWLRTPETPARPPVRLTLDEGDLNINFAQFDVSPDGTHFVVADATRGLFVRRSDEAAFRQIPGTEGAIWPTFSPDGEWILFSNGTDLQKVAVVGGQPLTVLSVGGSLFMSDWGASGTIVGLGPGGYYRVPETGGQGEDINWAGSTRRPHLLPDGSGVIFASTAARIYLQDFVRDTVLLLQEEAVTPKYVPTGHILYGHPAGGLFALPFDLDTREVTGPPVPIQDGISVRGTSAAYAVSNTGTLFYNTGVQGGAGGGVELAFLDPEGGFLPVPLSPRNFVEAHFSPDGSRLAIVVADQGREVYTYDIALGTMTQLTFESDSHSPAWSPDGTRLAFASESEDEGEDLFVQPADGSGAAELLLSIDPDPHPTAWPNDTLVAFTLGQNQDLWTVSFGADTVSRSYLEAEWAESDLEVSPDGTLAAFWSSETGQRDVFVRGFPTPEGKWRISDDGGGWEPRWAPDGSTIYYWSPGQGGVQLVAARISTAGGVTVLSRDVVTAGTFRSAVLDVDPQTGRLVVARPAGTQAEEESLDSRYWVVVNWFEELRARLGGN